MYGIRLIDTQLQYAQIHYHVFGIYGFKLKLSVPCRWPVVFAGRYGKRSRPGCSPTIPRTVTVHQKLLKPNSSSSSPYSFLQYILVALIEVIDIVCVQKVLLQVFDIMEWVSWPSASIIICKMSIELDLYKGPSLSLTKSVRLLRQVKAVNLFFVLTPELVHKNYYWYYHQEICHFYTTCYNIEQAYVLPEPRQMFVERKLRTIKCIWMRKTVPTFNVHLTKIIIEDHYHTYMCFHKFILQRMANVVTILIISHRYIIFIVVMHGVLPSRILSSCHDLPKYPIRIEQAHLSHPIILIFPM